MLKWGSKVSAGRTLYQAVGASWEGLCSAVGGGCVTVGGRGEMRVAGRRRCRYSLLFSSKLAPASGWEQQALSCLLGQQTGRRISVRWALLDLVDLMEANGGRRGAEGGCDWPSRKAR